MDDAGLIFAILCVEQLETLNSSRKRKLPTSNGMNTTLTIRMEKKLRNEAKETARELGVPLTTAVNAMVKQFVRDRRLVLEDCPFPSHTPNAETRKAIRELRHGGGTTAGTTDEMFEQILGKNWRKSVFKDA